MRNLSALDEILESEILRMFLKVLLVSILATQVTSMGLKCRFVHGRNGYGCEMENVFSKDHLIITSVVGNHLPNQTDDNVAYFEIPEKSKTKMIPLNICLQFHELSKMFIYGELVFSVTRDVFKGCENLRTVFVSGTKIQWLNEDVFADLPVLENLNLSENLLKVLPMHLLSHNTKLNLFWAYGNQIEQIDFQFGPSLSNVMLERNICVRSNAMNSDEIERLNDEISRDCINSKQNMSNNRIAALLKGNNELSVNLSTCEKNFNAYQDEVSAKSMTQNERNKELEKQVAQLNQSAIERELVIEELLMNSTLFHVSLDELGRKLYQCNEDNSNEKSLMQQQIKIAENSTEKLQDELKKQRATNDDYNEILKKNQREVRALEEKVAQLNQSYVVEKSFAKELMSNQTTLHETLNDKDSTIAEISAVNADLLQENSKLNDKVNKMENSWSRDVNYYLKLVTACNGKGSKGKSRMLDDSNELVESDIYDSGNDKYDDQESTSHPSAPSMSDNIDIEDAADKKVHYSSHAAFVTTSDIVEDDDEDISGKKHANILGKRFETKGLNSNAHQNINRDRESTETADDETRKSLSTSTHSPAGKGDLSQQANAQPAEVQKLREIILNMTNALKEKTRKIENLEKNLTTLTLLAKNIVIEASKAPPIIRSNQDLTTEATNPNIDDSESALLSSRRMIIILAVLLVLSILISIVLVGKLVKKSMGTATLQPPVTSSKPEKAYRNSSHI